MAPPLTTTRIVATWWPLAASWLLMGMEGPTIAAVISRLGQHEVHLAALGGVVFPLALIIEAPIIMMLAASTALARDQAAYRYLRRFMTLLAAGLTLAHALLAFTPLFDVVAGKVLAVPEETLEPARLGLRIMILWTWAIADRRFHQGLLIRFGRQNRVGVGTLLRLCGTATPLAIGLMHGSIPGIVVAATALSTGVIVEAAYARWCARDVIRGPLAEATSDAPPLTFGRLIRFYVPLAMTPLLALLAMPIGAAGMARMPESLASLAVWPALSGFSFLLRSIGVAFNEVVVRHAGDPGGPRVLARFAWISGTVVCVVVLLFAATALGPWWFGTVSGLDPDLTQLACAALWWGIIYPLMSFLHSLYQGLLVHEHRTRGITEAVAVFIVVTACMLQLGIVTRILPGASMAFVALTSGAVAQSAWLAWRCRAVMRGTPEPEPAPEDDASRMTEADVPEADAPVRIG